MKRSIGLLLFFCLAAGGGLYAQSAKFNFSASAAAVSGWTNVVGDPSVATVTATSSGITVSSIATANWVPYNSASAFNGVGENTGNSVFPGGVLFNHWYQYGSQAEYNVAVPQLLITGLNKDSIYTINMAGSSTSSLNTNPVQYTVVGLTVYPSQYENNHNNTSNYASFNVIPDTSGHVKIYINTQPTTDIADISGLTISSNGIVPLPTDSITSPRNGSVLSEDGNILITANAAISNGSITKMDFYHDTILIGTSTTAPYNITWFNPDPGSYQLIAKATDYLGRTVSSSIRVSIESLNYFWSTTGNIATGGDSAFLGTVDSNHLAFRTKNLERMVISALGNVGIGLDSPTAQLHTTGSVRLAGLGNDSSNAQPRMLVSDSSGKLYYRSIATGGLNAGPGLGQTSTGIALGDSIPGAGPHSFTSNRYQYLNGHQYSIGGTVNDPVNHPVFRMYNNGDLAAGTTMDQSVNTDAQTGLRYYSKLGILQIGATDHLDTSVNIPNVPEGWPGGGILMNSDNIYNPNNLRAYMHDSYVAGNTYDFDSTVYLNMTIVNGQNTEISNGIDDGDVLTGYGLHIKAQIENSVVSGAGNWVTKPCTVNDISGFENKTMDSARGALIGGAENQYGGLWQLAAGVSLINRTPGGTTLGSFNTDFASLPYTGLQGLFAPNITSYPVFVVGNGNGNGYDSSITRSNAVTVLYNGRTQINTMGFNSSLTQAQVTPQAALDVVSTNTGVLLPRLTTSQRNAIVSGDLHNGLLLYNTDSSVFQYYNGSAWNSVGSGGSGSSGRWLFANGTVYDSSDNVAIGTNNPQGYKLAVNGTAMFTKVKVKPVGSWPDYVFRKGYVLPELEELERYVFTHHHLPGIASEQEVKDGIDVGEQQTAVLKKVEELTLYLIRENKTLAEQNKQIGDQGKLLSEQNKQLSAQNAQLEAQNARLEAQQKEIDELKAMIRANKH